MKIARSAARVGQLFNFMPGALPAVQGLALAGLVAITAWSPAARAIPVLSPAANIVVPANSAGIYINVVSGASGGSTTTGWDINPWGTASAFIYAPTGGGIVSGANSPIASLLAGATIGVGSSFSASPNAATFGALAGQWTLNASNYFGFSFVGDDSLLHYGYGSMIVGATATTRTVGQLWYESAAGTAITISAVPEPSSAAMLLAGGALGAFALRRRRQASR